MAYFLEDIYIPQEVSHKNQPVWDIYPWRCLWTYGFLGYKYMLWHGRCHILLLLTLYLGMHEFWKKILVYALFTDYHKNWYMHAAHTFVVDASDYHSTCSTDEWHQVASTQISTSFPQKSAGVNLRNKAQKNHFTYCIAGNICGNLILRFAIELSCAQFYFCKINWNWEPERASKHEHERKSLMAYFSRQRYC